MFKFPKRFVLSNQSSLKKRTSNQGNLLQANKLGTESAKCGKITSIKCAMYLQIEVEPAYEQNRYAEHVSRPPIQAERDQEFW